MSSIKVLQKNVELWAKCYPKQAILLPYIDCAELVFCKAKNGELNLEITGKYIYQNEGNGPSGEAKQWFASLELDGVQVLYVYGVGLGAYYDAAKAWLEQDRTRSLVFIEDEMSILYRFFETEKATEILNDPQVQLHYFHKMEDSPEIFEFLYWNFIMSKIKVTALRYYEKDRAKLFNELHHKIVYNSTINDGHLDEYLKFGKAFFRNFYLNMLCLEGAYLGNKLFRQFSKVPAIICGAGPSLVKQIPLLKKLKNNAVIFAGGSALNALNAASLLPHFGAGIDPNSPQFDRLIGNQAFQLPFFYRNRLLHEAFKVIHGPRLYVTGSGGYDISTWFEKKMNIKGKLIDEGYNVVNFCVEIAHAMGCDPIIFVGMDLAFTDMKSYAPGVIADNQVSQKQIVSKDCFADAALLRPDIYGKDVYTVWKWIAESEWISSFAKNHPKATLINSTEGGIGFAGVPNQPLKEVAEQLLVQEYDLNGRIHGEIEKSSLSQVKFKKIVKVMKELKASLHRTIGHLDVLSAEIKEMKKKIKKEGKMLPTFHTGRAALCEIELAEEPAFIYVLEIFNAAYSKMLNREINPFSAKQSEVKAEIKKLDLHAKKFDFLKDVANVNIEQICSAFKEYGVEE